MLSKRLLRAQTMPSGMPITAQKNTEVSTSARVVMDSDHTPISPSRVRVTKHNKAMRLPASCQPSRLDSRIPMLGGMLCRVNSMPLSTWSIGQRMARNTSRKLCTRKFRALSTQVPRGIVAPWKGSRKLKSDINAYLFCSGTQ
ncbi:hypothetical protein D3C76_689610 [compost metagenome]